MNSNFFLKKIESTHFVCGHTKTHQDLRLFETVNGALSAICLVLTKKPIEIHKFLRSKVFKAKEILAVFA